MSYILDALQRADRERNLGEVPKLDMALQSEAATRRRGWLPTALLIVFLASLIATGLWMLQNGYLRFGSLASTEEAPASESTPAVARAGAEPEAPARPAAAQTRAEPAPITTEPDSGPAPQAQPAREAAAPQSPAATTRAETPEPKSPAEQPAATAKAVAPEPGPAPEPELEAEPEAKSRSARMPTPTVAPAPPPSWMRKEEAERFRQSHAPTEPVQSYLGLPQSYRDSLGKLEMSAHVFSTNPARSFVLINGKRYRIGEYLAEGPELVDILPDGAVLEHRGETFLLPVQR